MKQCEFRCVISNWQCHDDIIIITMHVLNLFFILLFRSTTIPKIRLNLPLKPWFLTKLTSPWVQFSFLCGPGCSWSRTQREEVLPVCSDWLPCLEPWRSSVIAWTQHSRRSSVVSASTQGQSVSKCCTGTIIGHFYSVVQILLYSIKKCKNFLCECFLL